VDELCAYDWPGNVRELQNCMERAVILTDGDTIHGRHLSLTTRRAASPAAPADPWSQIDLSGSLGDAVQRVAAEAERRKIEEALKESAGNQEQAADRLRITPRALFVKLREHRLTSS
jgi:DNA-binding NtrC family response regulator